MEPIRKRFDGEPSFPFSLAYRETKSTQRELPDHLHDWYEIVYIHGGVGSFFIDHTIFPMRAGDLFVIPGNTIHRAFPDKDDPTTSTAAFFSPLLVSQPSFGESFSYLHVFERSRLHHSYKIECGPDLQTFAETQFGLIDRELRGSKPGSRHAVSLLLQQLLLAINREAGANPRRLPHSPAIGPAWMRETLLYIDAHFAEDIGLKELCARVSVSPAHFSRLFRQLTGMNVTAFIAAKRMIRAKELLLATDRNVAAIAQECGFDSLPHFYRMFKRIVGVTPSDYRHGLA